MVRIYRFAISVLGTIVLASPALATCGDVDGSGTTTSSDVLTILRAATGIRGEVVCLCDDCDGAQTTRAPGHCADLNGDTQTTAQDALAVLRIAIGVGSPACSCDACVDGATTTTSSTLAGCPTQDALDGRVYVRKSYCNVGPLCTPSLTTDEIRFDHLGNGEYAVRSLADETTLYVGTYDCTRFEARLLQWTFAGYSSFSGRGPYCNYTGAEAPTVPPDPMRPVRCPPQV